MSVMEILGFGDGVILYGDRSAELVAAGGSKVFKAPFRGYVKSLVVQGELDPSLVITINDVVVDGVNVAFEAGDIIKVTGAAREGAVADRIGLEVGVTHS